MNINLFGFLESENIESEPTEDSITSKESEYMKYISEHVDRVIKFYHFLKDKIFVNPEDKKYQDALDTLGTFIANHDQSKYSDEEFDPYRIKFYPTLAEKISDDNEEDFQAAWDHHKLINPHHPQYWYDYENKVAKEMPLEYILEMICDWGSFGDIKDWWNKNPEGKLEKSKYMTKNTLDEVESILARL